MTRLTRRSFLRTQLLAGSGALLGLGLPPLSLLHASGSTPPFANGGTRYLDALTRIGPRRNKHSAERWSLEHLKQEQQQVAVAGGLVQYTQSLYYDTLSANLELSRMLEGDPARRAVWNVIPWLTGEFPDPDRLFDLLREHGVAAVSLHPATNAWDWQLDANQPLVDRLEAEQVLTITSRPELGSWRDVDRFLTRWPRLPLLLTGAAWSEQRYLLPLLHRHRNLHVTLERFQINQGIEYLVGEGFARQILFGTAAPQMSSGAQRAWLDYSGIPEEDRTAIAGGNLIRLTGWPTPPNSASPSPNEDDLMRQARHGRPINERILDLHMHMLEEGLSSTGEHYRMEGGDPEGVFSLMERLGVNGGGIMSWNGVVSGDMEGGFRTVRQALDAAPSGYWGLATLEPTHLEDRSLGDLALEVYRDRRLIGMKPYPFYGIAYDDPAYAPWWELGDKLQLYGLLHQTRSDGSEVRTLAERYPNVRWIIAHAGSGFAAADVAIEAMQAHKNVYAEITYTSVPGGMIEYLCEHAGADRILYGSDLPMRDPRPQLGWVLYSRLSMAEKRAVLAENAARVIEPCLHRLPDRCRPSWLNRTRWRPEPAAPPVLPVS